MINNGSSCIHIFVHIQLLNLIYILTRTPIVTQLFAQPAPDQGFPPLTSISLCNRVDLGRPLPKRHIDSGGTITVPS